MKQGQVTAKKGHKQGILFALTLCAAELFLPASLADASTQPEMQMQEILASNLSVKASKVIDGNFSALPQKQINAILKNLSADKQGDAPSAPLPQKQINKLLKDLLQPDQADTSNVPLPIARPHLLSDDIPLPRPRPHLATDGVTKAKVQTVAKPKAEIARPKQEDEWSGAEVKQAITMAAVETGLKYSKLGTVAMLESGIDPTQDGKGKNGKTVARGLMQITIGTLFGILNNHKDEAVPFLSKFGQRFEPALDWMKGDHSAANKAAVKKEMYDPVFSAYMGALYYKDLGAGRDPESAYLRYVAPAMGYAIDKLPAKSKKQVTAKQLAKTLNLPMDVVSNNPGVFGPDGNWSVEKVVAENHAKFVRAEASLQIDVAVADTPDRPSFYNVGVGSVTYSVNIG